MNEVELLELYEWNPFAWLGIDYSLLKINTIIILNTWITLCILILLIIISRYALHQKDTVSYYMVTTSIRSFMDFAKQTLGTFNYQHFSVVFSFFIFILLCNCLAVIPWTTEPTKDLNTTLAFGLIIFFYKDWQGIRAHGLKTYAKEFLQPIFLMLPINLIGHFSKIISISFRLFGNIFGGAVIIELYRTLLEYSVILEIAGLFSGINFIILLFFGVFEGLIQAFVFAMLSLTYLSLALQKED